MKWRQYVHLALFAVVGFFFGGGLVRAQEFSLVTGGRNGDYRPEGYGICELADMLNNVMLFILSLLALIAVIAILYTGYFMVTSRGSAAQIDQAKSFLANVLVGGAIMLAAYLIVNTVLGILLGSGSAVLGWQSVDCSYENEVGDAEYEIRLTEEDLQTIIAAINATDPNLLANAAGACTDGNIAKVWGSLADQANCIITHESSCGATPISRSDVSTVDGNPFSFGAMQINTTVHHIEGCQHLGIQNMDCKSAWSGANYGAHVVNQSLYEQCRAALLNNECNMINGLRIYHEAGNSWGPWSTKTKCGLR